MAKERTLHRSLVERWVITGTLTLESPAHFGNGDADPLTDMPLLADEATGKPLLPGTSIAGALRNYLRERALGYGKPEEAETMASELFGGWRGNPDGEQSPLIVFDSVSATSGFELRDGVAIDDETRTAEDKKKFDLELLAAGTTFPLRFELLISQQDDSKRLRDILATALAGLNKIGITLGARKRRGFGQVSVGGWQVIKYDLKTEAGLLAWLSSERGWQTKADLRTSPAIEQALDADLMDEDARQSARLTATFTLDGTLMIRSGFGASDSGPDTVHLHAPRLGGTPLPVIPGTSWAGVLRGRAEKIARTVSSDLQAEDKDGKKLTRTKDSKEIPLTKARAIVDGMFGPSEIKPGQKDVRASRVSIKESIIEQVDSLVVTRVKIDRFTGGAFESALFTEQPVVGQPLAKSEKQPKEQTQVKLDLTLRKKPQPTEEKEAEQAEKEFQAEIGLLLLLLKDLWTGDLPIGGESGVGRGRLKGVEATLKTPAGEWTFEQKGDHLIVPPKAETLETWVDEFNQAMKKAQVQA